MNKNIMEIIKKEAKVCWRKKAMFSKVQMKLIADKELYKQIKKLEKCMDDKDKRLDTLEAEFKEHRENISYITWKLGKNG